ncbi:hypothetical protein AK812_SmicGene39540 [Symbiodinium microadriaticum]|uniref:Uncharacterized protein n=1 Tax=Symbiodinium microadriaticum TaxID=2951 RepID=A0A1Q9CBA0_SYMMI|nr:hypothetical protein AK812_SmicGene39540 [Symbiodinium microadriaticum]
MRRKGNRYNGGRTHENGKGRVWSQVEHGSQEEELAPPAATPLMQDHLSKAGAQSTELFNLGGGTVRLKWTW